MLHIDAVTSEPRSGSRFYFIIDNIYFIIDNIILLLLIILIDYW